ncbi:MAG: hypothetical protein RRY29_06135 [Desulfovibrionaceae bacterium]
MPTLSFFKCSPGGNPTLLLPAAGLSPCQQEYVANTLLNPLHLYAEQVGFIDLHTPSLRMAGGEFCVNATRSLGALLALHGLLRPRPNATDGMLYGTACISGLDSPIRLEVQPPQQPEQRCLQSAALVPLPNSVCCQPLEPGINLVVLPGIAHILIDASQHPLSAQWQADAARLRQRFALEHHDAVGCIWWEKQGEAVRMRPIVWVRALHSACYESSCGSGAMACALLLHRLQSPPLPEKDARYTLWQPSGTALCVSYLPHTSCMRIDGPVTLVAEGTVYIEGPLPQA